MRRVRRVPFYLENRNRIWRTRHTARHLCKSANIPSTDQSNTRDRRVSTTHLQRHTTQKETPSPSPFTYLTQALQIKHLTNRHTPPRQKPLMEHESLVRVWARYGASLKRRTVASYGGKLIL